MSVAILSREEHSQQEHMPDAYSGLSPEETAPYLDRKTLNKRLVDVVDRIRIAKDRVIQNENIKRLISDLKGKDEPEVEKVIEKLRKGIQLAKDEFTMAVELDYWATADLTVGKKALVNRKELVKNYTFRMVEMDQAKFICPADMDHEQLVRFNNMASAVDATLGRAPNSTDKTLAFLVPGSRYCPRGGAADGVKGTRIIVDMDRKDAAAVFVHEYIHTNFAQKYGRTKMDALGEGVAMYFTRQLCPNELSGDYQCHQLSGENEMTKIAIRDNRNFGLSHTQMLEESGKEKLPANLRYEFAYKFGGFFVEYIMNNYGLDKLKQLYKETCKDYFYDTQTGGATGNALIVNGIRIGKQREIMVEALRGVDLDPGQVVHDFDRYMRDIYDARNTGIVGKVKKAVINIIESLRAPVTKTHQPPKI